MKTLAVKINFHIVYKLFSKLKHRSKTKNDNHLFMQIIKLLMSIQRFYKISLKQISKENLFSQLNFKNIYEKIFSNLCQNIFICIKIKKQLKNVFLITFKKKYQFCYILNKLEKTFSTLISSSKYFSPIKESFSFPIVNKNDKN